MTESTGAVQIICAHIQPAHYRRHWLHAGYACSLIVGHIEDHAAVFDDYAGEPILITWPKAAVAA